MTLSEQIDKFANETRDTVDIICRIAKRQGKEEALEVIEDIRAEILNWEDEPECDDDLYQIGAKDMQKYVLAIIDKHIKESTE